MFKTTVYYLASSRPALATQDPVLKTKPKKLVVAVVCFETGSHRTGSQYWS